MARLVFVVWHGQLGGAQSLSLELCRAAIDRGHDAHMVFIKYSEPLIERARDFGVPALELHLKRGVQTIVRPDQYATRIKRLRPDLVVTMSVNRMAWAVRLGGYRGPLVAVDHGEVIRYLDASTVTRWLNFVDRWIAAHTITAQVAVSRYMFDLSESFSHSPRLIIIHNGIDLRRFYPREQRAGPITFGFAGRLIRGKGADDLIAAFQRVPGDLRLVIAGDGPQRGALEAAAVPDARIAFAGNVVDMPAFWNSVDVAVVPSRDFIESFGMSALEAMACGRPVIATHNGGLPEVVKAGAGTLVSPGAVEELAAAVASFASRARITATGLGARRIAETFSLDACLDRYLDLIKAVPDR